MKQHDGTAQKISDKECDNILKTTVTTKMAKQDMDYALNIWLYCQMYQDKAVRTTTDSL